MDCSQAPVARRAARSLDEVVVDGMASGVGKQEVDSGVLERLSLPRTSVLGFIAGQVERVEFVQGELLGSRA